MAKSLKDLASLIGRSVFNMTPVGQAFNATQRAVPIIQGGIQNFAQAHPQVAGVIGRAEPAYNRTQQFFQNMPAQPFQFQANTPNKPLNSLLDLGANIFMAPLNAPTMLIKSAYQFPQSENPREAIGNAAGIVNAVLAGSVPKGLPSTAGKIATQPKFLSGTQKIVNSIKEGVKTGTQYGTFSGAMTGLEQGKHLPDPKEYVLNLLKNTAVGAVAGGSLGGAVGGVGSVAKQTQAAIQGRARTNAKEMTQRIMQTDKKPIWAKNLSPKQIEEKLFQYYKLQQSQGGFVDLNESIGQSKSKSLQKGKTSAKSLGKIPQEIPGEQPVLSDKSISSPSTLPSNNKNLRIIEAGETEKTAFPEGRATTNAPERIIKPKTQSKIDDFEKEMDALAGKAMPINPKKSIQVIDGDEAKNLADRAELNAIGNQKGFQQIFSQFIGERDAAKTRGVKVGSSIKITPSKPEEIIKAIENPEMKVSPDTEKYISQFRKLDDEVFNQAKDLGLDIRYLKNHIAHFWKQSEQEVQQAFQVFKKKYGLTESRVIPTYEEGISMGLTPKFTSPSQILAESVKKLEETKAGINAFKQLKDQGFIVPASVGIKRGFSPINASGFPRNSTRINDELGTMGNWYAPKEIADQINRVFSPKDYGVIGDITSKTRNFSGLAQDIGLSGGVPNTPMNAFGAAQVTKESLAGRPIQAVQSFIRSFSDNASKKYFEKNADQIIKMQERNIPVSSSFSIEDLTGSKREAIVGAVTNAFKGQFKESAKNIGTLWNKTMNDPTFKRFMPQLQVSLFNDIEKAALKQGKDANTAADIAANAVKNFYGTIGSDVRARGQGIQDSLVQNFLGTLTFAPKFRESMVNFWVNNVKALKNPLALENRSNVAFIGGAIATYIAMDKINYALNGKHLSENPPGTEDKLLIPTGDGEVIGLPFLSSIATIPRALYREGKMLIRGDVKGAAKDAGQTYASMIIKPFMDVLANSDYFGKQIYEDDASATEKYMVQATYIATALAGHPYLKELFTKKNQDDPIYQRLSRAMELPLRFYTEATLNSKEYYGARDKALGSLSAQERSAFDAIPKYDKEDPNDPNARILKYQVFLTYPAVFEAKQKTELEMAARTGKAIDPLYLVDYETAKKYMRYETLPEGSQDRKSMTAAYPELNAMFDVRGKYFDDNPIDGLGVSKRPIASVEVQAAMDRKDWDAPGVREYLDANTQWNNQQREKLGLPAIGGGFAGYQKKVSPKKISFKPIKLSLPKQSKIQNIKIVSPPKPKAQKSIKIKANKVKPIKIAKLKGLTKSKKLV
jgi:hypothetical protein